MTNRKKELTQRAQRREEKRNTDKQRARRRGEHELHGGEGKSEGGSG
jgi:hypothetical protein